MKILRKHKCKIQQRKEQEKLFFIDSVSTKKEQSHKQFLNYNGHSDVHCVVHKYIRYAGI